MAAGLRDIGVPCDLVVAVRCASGPARHRDLPAETSVFVGRVAAQALLLDGDHSVSGLLKYPAVTVLRSPHVRPTAVASRRAADAAAPAIARDLGIV